jgi:diguanylate cyclase (GGDEF)-like protein
VSPTAVLLAVVSAIAIAALIGAMRLQRIVRKLRAEIATRRTTEATLQRQSTVDLVTGVLSRRGFLDMLARECRRAARHGYPLSVVMLDFDNFKTINDTYGHACGDLVLSAAAAACRQAVRDPDVVGRLGGDEFAVCLPQTDLKGTRNTAARICEMVAQAAVFSPSGSPVSVTTSAGCSVLQNGDSPESLVARADRAVYEAKRLGRNRVEH